ncbi:MAG: class I SAM-dependent methyltransferase [Deltaproteobacteria bacterium]|nr:class I SAM-dependent methyltransferase [Deltaproteobacteria bacterium]MBW2222643.1 class I SAM-dependent methyltransferase [Deltaproteobacteria bacterium]MBW2545647.1 class I SAM-dependent methyltransferase [Deltaproteobacteria bacterium]MBW2717651.1 class I SAM-dependent methyltransferase [Deltaproteobacteria bacterium]
MELHSVRSWWISSIAILALGCATATGGPTVAAPSSGAKEVPPLASGPVVEESSVRPGINALYFQPDALEKYTGVLEGERREVVQHRDEIIDAIGLVEGMVVADIGAGTGLFTTEIARRVEDHGAVFGVDIVPAFLDRIRERAKAEQLTNVTVVLGEERVTALEDASVDLAFMCDTYHHIEYPQTYMHSLFRTLRPGGTLVLIDFERIEGKTIPAILSHVRAGKQTVIDEVSQAGFVLESETELLEQNYYLHFRRP